MKLRFLPGVKFINSPEESKEATPGLLRCGRAAESKETGTENNKEKSSDFAAV